MATYLGDNLYSFEIVLPENPLKWLNCYVIKGETGRNLLVDTGFRRQECFDALMAGINELELTPDNTDIFISHLHSDHAGNAGALKEMGYGVIMGETEYGRMMRGGKMAKHNKAMGFPEEVTEAAMKSSPAQIYRSIPFTPDRMVNDGDILEYGGMKLRCICTPGHTPGHMCLYEDEKKIFLAGDHVLFDITPNITAWGGGFNDSLGAYMNSLRSVRKLDIEKTYPAHRNIGNKTIYQRIDELLEHHEARLDETLRMAKETPGATAYEIASRVRWKIRAKSWDDFPAGQKGFAVGECLSHLECLEVRGLIRRETDADTVMHFYPTEE